MHWEPTHVKLMLALRTAIRSERWGEVWQDATQEHHIHLRRAREQRATQRFEAQLSSLLLALLGFRPPHPQTCSTFALSRTSCRCSPGDLAVPLLIIPGNVVLLAFRRSLQKDQAVSTNSMPLFFIRPA